MFRYLYILPICFHSLNAVIEEARVFKRFEYKYTFKGPYISQPDGSIPFFESMGQAIPNENRIRLNPSLRNQKGAVWSKNKTTFHWWEVDLGFRITGRGKTGADGFAFWYIEDKPTGPGNVFGGPQDTWKGLGILWDSYDNDGNFNNPSIMTIINDGTKVYDYAHDGQGQYASIHQNDFRNKHYLLRAKIRFYNNMITIKTTGGMNKGVNESDYSPIMVIYDTTLPEYGYLGVSSSTNAMTGDDHDVHNLVTYSLSHPSEQQMQVSLQEQEKYEKDFQEQKEIMDKKVEEYAHTHPDDKSHGHHPPAGADEEEEWIDDIAKETNEIFQEQGRLRGDINEVMNKLDSVLGKHESLTVEITKKAQGGGGGIVGSAPAAQGGSTPTIQRYEVENLLSANRELLGVINDIKMLAATLSNKVGQKAANFPDIQNTDRLVQEAASDLTTLQSDLRSINERLIHQSTAQMPDSGSCPYCISPRTFVICGWISTLAILLSLIYKDNPNKFKGINANPPQRFY